MTTTMSELRARVLIASVLGQVRWHARPIHFDDLAEAYSGKVEPGELRAVLEALWAEGWLDRPADGWYVAWECGADCACGCNP